MDELELPGFRIVKVIDDLSGCENCPKSKYYIRCICHKIPNEEEKKDKSSTIYKGCEVN